jgi:hypothetical protein
LALGEVAIEMQVNIMRRQFRDDLSVQPDGPGRPDGMNPTGSFR